MQNLSLDLYQAQLEATRNVANIILSNTEKLDHLALNAAKSGVGDQLKYAQSLSAARDPDGLKSLQATFTKQAPDVMLSYYRDLFKVFVDTNAEIGKVAEEYLEDMKAVAIKSGNGALRGASTAESAAVPGTTAAPMLNFVNLWTKSYQDFAELTKQYMSSAEAASASAVKASSPTHAGRSTNGKTKPRTQRH